jgi:cell wall-associated NlpC family hydrolase
MDKADSLKEWALSKVGCGYVYGGTGVLCTEAYRKARAEQYPGAAALILGIAAKWDGKQVFDCAQFTRKAAQAVGLDLPSGASSQWRGGYWAAKGAIACLPAGRVCFLYHESKNASPMGHTGVCLGDGTEVDARGHAEGVIRMAIDKYPWTHWAIPLGLYTEEGITQTIPLLSLGSRGQDVTRLQGLLIAQGYTLPLHGADGSYGKETESAVINYQLDHGLMPCGTVGELTWSSLNKREPGLAERISGLEIRVAVLEKAGSPAQS